MPLPLLAIFAAGAAVLGASAQMDAKGTNEKAQLIADEAQSLYKSSKRSLEAAQGKTETSLLNLGKSKKQVLEEPVKQFLAVYERIKNIEFSESVGLDEIKNFTLEKQDALQLREMSDIYESTFSSGAAGAATGAVIALAASGSLPVVTGTLSAAGAALAAGEISAAAGLAGSALSFGAAMTPLAAIAAPALLFSGLNASIKADENLEKARTMYSEAEAASEQMKTSEVLCVAIAERADMFDGLLGELNGLFSYCTALLDGVTKKKMGVFGKKTVDAKKFTDDELKLVAVTRSLAGAVKAVINTPILTAEGAVSSEAQDIYEETTKKLPMIVEMVDDIKSIDYHAKAVAAKPKTQSKDRTEKASSILKNARNIIAIVIGWFVSGFVSGMTNGSLAVSMIAFATAVLLVMDNDTKSKLFGFVKRISSLAVGTGFCILFYNSSSVIVYLNHYIIASIIVGVVSMIIWVICLTNKEKKSGNLKRTSAKVFGCLFFFAIAVLVYAFLYKLIGISHTITVIITVILYAVFAYRSVLLFD